MEPSSPKLKEKFLSVTAGQQSRNELIKKHIFFTNTCTCSNEQHTTDSLFKKSLLKRNCVRDCLLHIQWTPKGRVAQSKLSLFVNQIQRPPHPPATNGNSAADPLTHAKVIPHSQSATFFYYTYCVFPTHTTLEISSSYLLPQLKTNPRNPKQNLKRLDLFSLNQNRKYQKKISFKITLHVRTQLFSLSALV